MMACIALQEEAVPGAIWSVVGAAESHLAIVSGSRSPQPRLNAVCRQPSRTIAGGKAATCERILCAQRVVADQGDASASLYEASLGRNGALLRRARSIGRLCLTYAVCNDTALVSAYYTRSLRAFACPLGSNTGGAPRQRRSEVRRGVRASTGSHARGRE